MIRAAGCIRSVLVATVVLIPMPAAAQYPAPPARGEWRFIWGTYLWASGLDGRAGSGNNVVDVDVSFRTVLKNLDGGLFMPIELRKDRWGAVIELIAVKVSHDFDTPGPIFDHVDLESRQTTIELSPRYYLVQEDPLSIEALAGIRLWNLSTDLVFTADDGVPDDLALGNGAMWVDPIVGGRILLGIGSRWFVQGRADMGGFGVGSEFTWQVLALLGWEITSGTTLRGGYRRLDVDYENSESNFLYDIATHGFILGFSLRL